MAEADGSRPAVTASGASGREGRLVDRGKVTSYLGKVFKLNPAGLNWRRAAVVLNVLLVPLVVFVAIGHKVYLMSAVLGLLFTVMADPGGRYGRRALGIALFGLTGAAVTALGFGIGGDAWGWLVLAAFATTLVAGHAIAFGAHRFVTGYLLNLWFIVTLGLASSFHHYVHITSYTWAQTLAWVGGSALWIAVTFVEWLVRGREDRPQPFAELPGDTARRKLTGPMIMFAVLRAVVIAGTVALAFGVNLSHGFWLPLSTTIAMKASLDQTTLTAVRRIIGTLIGAALAMLVLLIPASEHGLRLVAIEVGLAVVALIVLIDALAMLFWNYAIYAVGLTAGLLIFSDLLQPSDYATEGDRVAWTLCGVGIAVIVMFLAGLLARRTANAPPHPAAESA